MSLTSRKTEERLVREGKTPRQLLDYIPRLNVEISLEQNDDLRKYLGAHGIKTVVIRRMLDWLITMLKTDAGLTIGALCDNSLSVSAFMQSDHLWLAEKVKNFRETYPDANDLTAFLHFTRRTR